jgi:predicted outer membrane repeat protein
MRAESVERFPRASTGNHGLNSRTATASRARFSPARSAATFAAALALTALATVVVVPKVGATSVACVPGALVTALAAASGSGASGTVTLAAGCTYTMTAVNNTTDGSNAFPDILGSVTIVGSGATITRGTGAPDFRFFIVDDGGSLNLSGVTLSNGSIASDAVHGGAAILNRSQLTLNAVTFLNNTSLAPTGGGAIDNHDLGQMSITGSNFTGNVAPQGGAIEDEATQCHTSRPACGQATVTQTTFTNNSSTQFGGGAFESQLDTTTLPLCQPTWPQPASCQELGGAHDTFIGDTFSGNRAMTEGGGIANFGTTSVTNSSLFNNSIVGTGPSGDDGGGGVQNTGTITITQTTLYANTSLFGANVHDFNDSHQSGPPVTTLRMSIVANGVNGQNCSGSAGMTDGGYNLDTGSSCGFASANGSVSNTNPQVGPLQSNGGPTQTMALTLGSPAVDAIPGTLAGCSGSVDQRGITRPQGKGCDIGAFELVQNSTDTQPPTTPTGLAATSVGATSVSLGWNASTDNVGVAGYTVYRNGAVVGATGATTTSFVDSTASPTTSYSYTVDAFDAAGNHSAQSTPLVVTTTAASIAFVRSVTASTGSRLLSTTLTLSGRVSAGDLLAGWFAQWDAAGQVHVSDNVNGAWTRVQGTTYNTGKGDIALYYLVNSKASLTGLTVTISAATGTYLAGTVGEYSGAATFSPLDQSSLRSGSGTAIDSGPTAAVPAGELVFGAFTANSSVGSVTGGTSLGIPFTVRSTSGDTGDGDIVSSLAGAQDARFTIANSVSWYAVAAVFKVASPDTTPPTVPTGLTATNNVRSVTLSWSASTDAVGVVGYTVYRNGSALTTVSGTTLSYADTTVAPVTVYSYTVDAFDAAGNHSAQSAAATVVTLDWVPPTVPTGLTASAPTPTQVNLSWSASTDNVAVTGYTVYRGGSQLGAVNGSTLTFTDSTVVGLTTYSYTVDAFDAAGNHSSQSQAATVTTPAPPDTVPPTTPGGLAATATSPVNVQVSWTASTDDVAVSGYDVYRDSSIVATVGASTLIFNDAVAAGSTHTYTVDAVDVGGNHSATATPVTVTTPAADTTPPTTPGGVTANPVSSQQVSVGWNASTDNVAVTGYDVYRNGSLMASVSGSTLTFSDTTVTPGANYSYTVDAFDAAGNRSAQSGPVAVHVPAVVKFVQGSVITTGSRVTSVTVTIGQVAAGDLLVGWFGQYDSGGQVQVSDNINGPWTRSASTTWNGASGDIALYYVANAKAASTGLTITVSSASGTYLQASVGEYSGVAAVNPLDQVQVAKGTGTSADSGQTSAVGAGELVYGGLVATNGPGALTPGSSQGVGFVERGQSSSGTQAEEDIVGGAAGPQHAGFTFPTSVPWFMVCATFKAA